MINENSFDMKCFKCDYKFKIYRSINENKAPKMVDGRITIYVDSTHECKE